MGSEDRHIMCSIRLNRRVWFQWQAFCRANRVSPHQGIEALVLGRLESAGVRVLDEEGELMEVPTALPPRVSRRKS